MLLEKLKVMDNYTKKERVLANYILNHSDRVLSLSSYDLAKESKVSRSTITRLCKKLSIKGYHEFQLRFANEFHQERKHSELSTLSLKASKQIQNSIQFTHDLYFNIINETDSLIDMTKLSRIINLLKITHRIDFYGTGSNYYQALLVSERFRSVGFESNAYSYVNRFVLDDDERNKETIAVLISQIGNNPSMIECAKYLKEKRIKTISVSGLRSQELEEICDEHLYLVSKFDDITIMNSGRHLSLSYLLDIIFNHFYTLTLNKK